MSAPTPIRGSIEFVARDWFPGEAPSPRFVASTRVPAAVSPTQPVGEARRLPNAAGVARAAEGTRLRSESGISSGGRKRWPRWLEPQIRRFEETDPDQPITSNRELAVLGGMSGLNPVHLAALQAIIDANRLDENSSSIDWQDGDGRLEPLELGLQVWRGSELVFLALGPDRYTGFGYRVTDLPPEIGDFHSLEYLDVHGNRLAGLPPEIGDLGALRELRAGRNRLTDLPYELGQLQSLEVLMLAHNELSDLPESMGELGRLQVLRLDANPFWAVPDAVVRMPGIRQLGFAQSTGPGVPPGPGISTLPHELLKHGSLTDLVVSGNHICGAGAMFVSSSGVRVHGLSAQRC